MKEKLELLIKKEKLTAGRLAELLEVQPSRISQLKSGRNKQPSFDIIQKILQRFPHINPDWLLLDSDRMYREGYEPREEADNQNRSNEMDSTTADLFTAFGIGDQDAEAGVTTSGHETENPPKASENSTSRESHISAAPHERSEISDSHASSKIERVIVFYSDGTFQDFNKR